MYPSKNQPNFISNPFQNKYHEKIDVILFAHGLIGTVRGKSANGLMMHSTIFNVVAIVDQNAVGKRTSHVCSGVNHDVPIYIDLANALTKHSARALVLLISPAVQWQEEFKTAMVNKLDLINTSFQFLKDIHEVCALAKQNAIQIFDLRDVTHQQEYPNTDILKRKSKVVYVTGTDCGLGKRTAAFELTLEAKKQGINTTMYATGQTGLMLGEKGTVVDALVTEFSNGMVSQHVCQLSEQGYDLIFVEGQSDVFHPANSAMALAILHGANPDCIILVHDESRKQHKGFEEDSNLYKMHTLKRYIATIKMLSLPCGPIYQTVGIATLGKENIYKIKELEGLENMPVVDVRAEGGPAELLSSIFDYCGIILPAMRC